MKALKPFLAILFAFTIVALQASEVPKATVAPEVKSRAWRADVSIEPYATVAWEGINGEGTGGAGANVVTHINKTFSLWGFGESDDTEHSFIDRFGGGIRAEAKLGKRIRFDAGIGGGYDSEREAAFIRIPFGITAYVVQSKHVDLGPRLSYAFDISPSGTHGSVDGRLFGGVVCDIKF